MRHLGLPCLSPPSLEQLLALTLQVHKRVALILREHLPDDFLPPPIQTPSTTSNPV